MYFVLKGLTRPFLMVHLLCPVIYKIAKLAKVWNYFPTKISQELPHIKVAMIKGLLMGLNGSNILAGISVMLE